ncbi:MAG: class I mannose-6-phosphate isomerase [Erysipelotrichaceae bacterium]|nr:class I mannose-6-phosphate isomerase [Erysipelotrichaceae bacterium]
MSNYNRFPKNKIEGYSVIKGYESIYAQLDKDMEGKKVLVMETYPGVFDEEVLAQIDAVHADTIIHTIDLFKSKRSLLEQIQYHLTDDRVFGHMYYGELMDFIDADALQDARKKVKEAKGRVLIYGVGATLVDPGDVLVYLDLARWEITLRYRAGMPNYKADNADQDSLKKIKRGYYVEWRTADKQKMTCFERVDYFLDTNQKDNPKMVCGIAVRDGLKQVAQRPFRMVPYFDPGVWGGQWMKEVCNLDPEADNYAWSFDGVPEENSLYMEYDNDYIEIPCMDLVLFRPKELLGGHVYSRFGAEFPIRFDFLDTMGGQNLSLQVHPLTEYIHRQFGMAYTQDESYYILDAKEDGSVFLGLKDNVDPEEMFEVLEAANRGEKSFDALKYVNEFPAKKHDHFLIPAGTIHCSGSNAMILEISATPYNFTFKLWDWDRVGLDGLPRPVHLAHGKKNIRWERTTDWVRKNLVNAIVPVEENEHYKEEHTGLHELEFIETRRLWIEDEVIIENQDNVNMMNLVEGQEARIESLDGSFAPFVLHYAETMIVPAAVKGYKIVNPTGQTIGILRAYVR